VKIENSKPKPRQKWYQMPQRLFIPIVDAGCIIVCRIGLNE